MNLKKVPDQTLEVFIDTDTKQLYLRIQSDADPEICRVSWLRATDDGEGLENVESKSVMVELDAAAGRGYGH